MSKNTENLYNKQLSKDLEAEIHQYIDDYNKINNLIYKSQNNKVVQFKNNVSKGKFQNNTIINNPSFMNQNIEVLNKINNNTSKVLGLNNTYNEDIDNKTKAQMGLLLLLNKLSKGKFMPDIKEYFSKKRQEAIDQRKLKDNSIIKENEEDNFTGNNINKEVLSDNLSIHEKNIKNEKKKMFRQQNITKTDKEEGLSNYNNSNLLNSEYDNNIDSKFFKANVKYKNKKQINYNSKMLNKNKLYNEDENYDNFDKILSLHFNEAEVKEYLNIRNNQSEEKFVDFKSISLSKKKK